MICRTSDALSSGASCKFRYADVRKTIANLKKAIRLLQELNFYLELQYLPCRLFFPLSLAIFVWSYLTTKVCLVLSMLQYNRQKFTAIYTMKSIYPHSLTGLLLTI